MRALAGLIAAVASLVLCPATFGAYLYVANSTAPGTISQFSVNPDGTLAPLSPPTVPTVASGQGATGIDVSPDGKNVIAGNFSAGNLVRFTVNPNGTLSSAPAQTIVISRAQQVRYSPDGRSVYVPVANQPGFIEQYSVAADGTLTPKTPLSVGGGQATPGPVAINRAGTRAYAGQNGGTGVAQFAVAGDGTLSPLSPLFVTTGPGGSQARVVALSPDGTSLYAPQSGSSNVAQFAVSPVDGTLAFVATYPAGGQPRGPAISADGTSVYAANSTNGPTGNTISQYTRAPDGTLTPKSPPTVASGSISPDAIVLSRDGRSAYVTNQGADKVSQFTVEADGTLTPKTPLLVTAAPGANQLVFSDGPPVAPVVATAAASAVATSSASLGATVDPGGSLTTFVFEYGATPGFGSITPADDAGLGHGAVAVSGGLTGLTSNTTYYYRVVASNALGTTTGAVRSFRTGGPPQAPLAVTLAPAATGTSSADLAGQVNPRGQATAFTFEYGTSTSFGAIAPVVALDDADALEPVSASLAGLTADTTYYYRLVAASAGGTAAGDVMSFSTGPGGAPIVTTGVATSIASSGATLNGTVDAHGSPTGFAFEYGPTTAFGSLSVVDNAGSGNGAQSVSLPVGGLAPGTTYRYRLIATNANGTTAGVVRSFTTAAEPPRGAVAQASRSSTVGAKPGRTSSRSSTSAPE